MIVLGTSWGGLHVLRTIISALPSTLEIPVVVVQHRHRQSDRMLSTLLQDMTELTVCEVEDKTPVAAGSVFIAPADYHLLVDDGHFALSLDAPVRFSRPSIDVTFVSVADSYGPRAVGVVLTGANADGSRGLERIHERGGLAIVQDPDTAESPMMPRAALRAVRSAKVMKVADMAPYLASLPVDARVPHARRGIQTIDSTNPRNSGGGASSPPPDA